MTISLECDDDALTLEITDDGKGISDTPTPAGSTGINQGSGKGLTILRHRADMIDASLDVFAHHRGGTTVRCVKSLPTGPPNRKEDS